MQLNAKARPVCFSEWLNLPGHGAVSTGRWPVRQRLRRQPQAGRQHLAVVDTQQVYQGGQRPDVARARAVTAVDLLFSLARAVAGASHTQEGDVWRIVIGPFGSISIGRDSME